MSVKTPVDHSSTKYVPCSRASTREHGKHPVTISYAEDGAIVGLSCACNRKTDADEALHRLGGDLCYKTVERVRAAIKTMQTYSDEANEVEVLFKGFREGLRQSICTHSAREDLRVATEESPLLERLSSKRCSDVAGFPIKVFGAAMVSGPHANSREMCVFEYLVATRDMDGRWDLHQSAISGAAGNVNMIKNGICLACRKSAGGRTGEGHRKRDKHYESVLFAVQQAVAVLRRANTAGRKTLECLR